MSLLEGAQKWTDRQTLLNLLTSSFVGSNEFLLKITLTADRPQRLPQMHPNIYNTTIYIVIDKDL